VSDVLFLTLYELPGDSWRMEIRCCLECHLLSCVWQKCFIVVLSERCYRVGW